MREVCSDAARQQRLLPKINSYQVVQRFEKYSPIFVEGFHDLGRNKDQAVPDHMIICILWM